MESDEEDFVFYGTPIEREEEITTRKKKAAAETSGQLRMLPAWKQEVRDEEGRRRFHGAFTGGYSAGYYNTVGSKEGWTPQSFTSSRKSRAEVKEQSIFNFLDEDEKAELEGRSLGTSMQFDTFGFTATELARKQAEKEQQKRPSAIPGPVPVEIIAPATDSIGVKLLLKMGWRRGCSIKNSTTNSLYDTRREARKAFLALSADDKTGQVTGSEMVEGDIESSANLPADDDTDKFAKSTPVYVLNPKMDLHGLGYDPFKYAPEFREKKKSRTSGTNERNLQKPLSVGDSLFGFKSGRVAPGFGTGALEDLDAEDEDVYAPGYSFEDSYAEEIEEPSRPMIEDVKRSEKRKDGVLPGFKAASISDYRLERFDPPVIPKDFVPHHEFITPLDVDSKLTEAGPPEAPLPEDNNLQILIDGMATLVARCGKLFEDLSREKNQSNPLFAFLFGGNGHDYYARRLWEERKKHTGQNKQQLGGKLFQDVEKMTAESRGKILGEKPLERSIRDSAPVSSAETVTLQYNLLDTFTKPASLSELPEAARPFREDPAKQERFEHFLKEKYQGGLRSKDAGGASKMSEAARARERLEFEAAAEVLEKGKSGRGSMTPSQMFTDVLSTSGLQFTTGALEPVKVIQDEELVKRKRYPKREEFQWRPSPILCKRFDLIDPYMGKPPPAPRSKSKMDTLIFMPDPAVASEAEENVTRDGDLPSISQMGSKDKGRDLDEEEIKVDMEVEKIERPVDLYKAIFSDDSDDDEDDSNTKQVEDPQRKTEAVNTTLNRLIAGDFLESLGKELGLEVPPDLPHSDSRVGVRSTRNETKTAYKGEKESQGVGNSKPAADYAGSGSSMVPEMLQSTQSHQHIMHGDGRNKEPMKIKSDPNDKNGSGTSGKIGNKDTYEKIAIEENKDRSTMQRHQSWSSDSSEDERRRKRGRHRRRSTSSDDDTSGDYRDRDQRCSRSKVKRKRSSQEKSSSRRRSKHHKHRDRDSPERHSHRSSRKEHGDRKDRRKYED